MAEKDEKPKKPSEPYEATAMAIRKSHGKKYEPPKPGGAPDRARESDD